MNQEYITVGKVISTQGTKGEVNVLPLTDSISRFKNIITVFIKNNHSQIKLTIDKIRVKKDIVVLKLTEISNIEQAEVIIGSFLEIERKNALILPEDTYFIFEIIGLEVYNENNVLLGKVENVISTGSNDVYVVRGKNKSELYIPAIREVVKDISIEKKRITINMVDGLL